MNLTPEQLWEVDAAVAEHVMGAKPSVVLHVSNDGGKSSAFDNADWSTRHIDIHAWLKEKQDRGMMAEYSVVEIKRYPAYSSDIAAAWTVIEKMQDFLPSLVWKCGDSIPFDKMRWTCDFRRDGRIGRAWAGAAADTAPLAICLAALKAVGKPYEVKA